MGKNDTKTSSPRLLLNAEPFGFGPAAAIAGFFPHLRSHFNKIGYVGKRHTLDLQQNLGYDLIHDVSAMDKDEREDILNPIFEEYDVFLSAMDHKMADLAKKAGLKVFYYDALTWYWDKIPESVQTFDLYMGQDFFSVKDRFNKDFLQHSNAHIVSPIVPDVNTKKDKKHILINLGGLQNPYCSIDEIIIFAENILDSLSNIIPKDKKIIIASSQNIADKLGNKRVRKYSKNEMANILAESELAFMTSGLGNIYDAAAYNLPTIWLPPANDSQGQQLNLLKEHDMSDNDLDWYKFSKKTPIDYKANQITVLNKIVDTAKTLSHDSQMQLRLTNAAQTAYNNLINSKTSKTQQLIKIFGSDGEKQVTDLVIKHAPKGITP